MKKEEDSVVKLTLTTDALTKHPNLVAIDGRLYDLKGFAAVHPGGELIRSAGGYDGTALFYSMHPGKKPMESEMLQKYFVGFHERVAGVDPIYTFNSAFALDLQKTLQSAMGKTSLYAPIGFWFRLICIGLLTATFECLWITTGNIFAGIIVGIMHAQIGLCIQHDASHGAISKNPAINAFFSYWADLIGNSRWIWYQQHVLWHHPHTNHQDLDPDASSAEPLLVFKDYSKTAKNSKEHIKPLLSSQDFITHAILSLYGPVVVFNPSVLFLRHNNQIPESVSNGEFMTRQKPLALLLRIFYICRIIIAPWYFSNVPFLLALLLVNIVAGTCLTFLFVVSHNFEGSNRDPLDLTSSNKDPVCWYKAQTETSCTYGGYMAMALTGGLNYQIEHHLFPRVSSWHYPRIHEDIRKCCTRHNVKYAYYPSLWSNTLSMLKYMRKVGVMATLSRAD